MNETHENLAKSNETHKTTNAAGRRNMKTHKKEHGQFTHITKQIGHRRN